MHRQRLLLLLLLSFLDGTLGNISELVADCTDFQRCQCARGVTGGRPAMAIVTNTKTNRRCIGVLINDRYVISTSECTVGLDQKIINPELIVTFENSNQEFDVSQIFVHHNHAREILPHLFDMMLIRLTLLVDMKKYVPICLPHASLLVYSGTPAWVMTVGLRPLSVKVQTGTCSFMRQIGGHVRTIRVRPGMFLCVGNIKTSFCYTEPGYLLIMMVHGWYMLLGISSSNYLFPMCSYSQGLFSEVLPYRAWIRNITDDSSNCQFVY
ncbi:serine protease 30-like [Portunus trituberculatus]|uniref:serine protease 30-like n=1 Tax=Portunus trituberculatus TaxID=210409 RepID=UPI001E1D0F4E|nr:serine protease 30-like [Portunus trituberculatus]